MAELEYNVLNSNSVLITDYQLCSATEFMKQTIDCKFWLTVVWCDGMTRFLTRQFLWFLLILTDYLHCSVIAPVCALSSCYWMLLPSLWVWLAMKWRLPLGTKWNTADWLELTLCSACWCGVICLDQTAYYWNNNAAEFKLVPSFDQLLILHTAQFFLWRENSINFMLLADSQCSSKIKQANTLFCWLDYYCCSVAEFLLIR